MTIAFIRQVEMTDARYKVDGRWQTKKRNLMQLDAAFILETQA